MSIQSIPIERIDKRELYASLMGYICPSCGGPKHAEQSLCAAEHATLPLSLRLGLLAPIGDGYETAMLDALKSLHVHTFLLPENPANERRAS